MISGFIKTVKFIALGIFPILLGLTFTAHDFIHVVYSDKWLLTVIPMQILCVGIAFGTVNTALNSLMNAKGRPDLPLKWNGIRLVITAISILIGVHWGVIVGVAWGMVAAEFFSIGLVYQTFRLLDKDFKRYFYAMTPASVSSIVMMICLFVVNQIFLKESIPAVRLGIDFVVGAAVYISVVVFCFKSTLTESINIIKMFSKR